MNPAGLALLFGLALTVASAEPIRIAVVADTHTTRGTNDDQVMYRGRFDRIIAAINATRVDFVLIAGDLTQNGAPGELEDFKRQVRGFQAPVHWVPGNHDVGHKFIPGQPGGPTARRLADFERVLGPSFWARSCGGVRVLGINSQLFGSGLPQEDEMWKLLEKETAIPTRVPLVVLMHMPPFVQSPDEPGGDYWVIEPAPRARLLALFARGGVHTVLTGHLHRSLVNPYEGMLIVTTLPASFGLPRGVAPQGWTLITLPCAAGGQASWRFQPVPD